MDTKQCVIDYYNRSMHPHQVQEILIAYMQEFGKPNHNLIQELFSGMNPIYQLMVEHALQVCIEYFEKKHNLVKMYDTQTNLIAIWYETV